MSKVVSDICDLEIMLLNYFRSGNWKEVLNLLDKSNSGETFYDQKYLWISPSEDALSFLTDALKHNSLSKLTSVGCGCGIFEWLIHCYSGVEVVGIEVNKKWWESKYSPPIFIPLKYADEASNLITIPDDCAVLFCYFNDWEAFNKYMLLYKGKCLIIIGPAKGRAVYTNPEPFDKRLLDTEWEISAFQEILSSKDYIVVYNRK